MIKHFDFIEGEMLYVKSWLTEDHFINRDYI